MKRDKRDLTPFLLSAPFKVHLVSLDQNNEADKIYQDLAGKGVEVLYDDREDKTAGEKFSDADLIGCPVRLVVSKKLSTKIVSNSKNGIRLKQNSLGLTKS